ncbi:hypothetical protein L917_15104 [Plasmopara halstedii]|uniref:B box-type domain-containing protein n=1 Tax=Plasmopara halstedii TaxID=4781 RepID=A0A0P1ATR9_PLAHL|nr:hypothetical protein L917_15104 [Plasmopara halstedii]CEG44577.1 hypothetical protein L917_15104 [Plasmopara halstedii]|eukprot:XP_024580946.1 hypothetical protein L917_15104 [Plasmopara halstedii]
MEDQENPSFACVLEPAQLQRPHCDQCRIIIADYECHRCVQRFCRQCELVIHHRLAELAVKHEESKSDGRPHQEFLKWISACQECGQNMQEFFCANCNTYQCESCCATKHRQLEMHLFFCVEGSSPKMFPFASWNLFFVEMVKKSKGDLQVRAANAKPAIVLACESVRETQKAKSTIRTAAHEYSEKAVFANSTVAALGNLSINVPFAATAPTETTKHHGKCSTRLNSASIVDLTFDDESEISSGHVSIPPPQPYIKDEFRVKVENSWLTSVASDQHNQVYDADELMEKTMGDDEDPIVRSVIGEYNALSAKIFEIDQEVDRVKKKTKELSGVKPINMQEVQKALSIAQRLRKHKAEAEKSRDGVVANVVAYLKSDPDEMKAFLDTCTADVPTAQTAIHRKCAALEASILSKLEDIRRNQRNMEELMSLKKDAFAEVTRLGAEIAQGEDEVRKLDKERRGEFITLCQFSKSIQATVREMAANVKS